MKRILGLGVGIVWLVFAFLAFQNGAEGRAMGADDVGLWWTVIAGILTIAASGALVGTILHTRTRE